MTEEETKDYCVDFTRKEYHWGDVIVEAKSKEDAKRQVKEYNLTETEPADREFYDSEDIIEEANPLDT